MADDLRPSFKLGRFKPDNNYDQPHLEPNGDVRTKEHEVLDDISVIQELGENAERFTLRGEAYEYEIETLREMKGEKVEIRHIIYSGDVLIKGVRAQSTSSWENIGDYRRWVYTYTVDLIEVV
jgi:hypothetical protein